MIEPGSLLRSLTERTTARNFQSRVIHEIGAGVVSGRFPVGTALPNDAALMDEFGVSRTVLREALKSLEAKGLVEARPKVGTKVAHKSRWNLYDAQVLAWHLTAPPDRDFLQGLGEVRRSLEPLGAAHAAAKRTSDQVRLMRYWIQQMEMSLDQPSVFCLADFELHRIIGETSRNPFIRGLHGVIELSHAFAYLKAVNQPEEGDLLPFFHLHRGLVNAIEGGGEAEARMAMLQVIDMEQVI